MPSARMRLCRLVRSIPSARAAGGNPTSTSDEGGLQPLGGLIELLEQQREIDLAHQGRRERLSGGAPDAGLIRFYQRALVRVDHPNMRNAGGQVVPDLRQHLRNFVVRRHDLDGQIGLREDRSHLMRQGLYADIGDAVTRLLVHPHPQFGEHPKPAFPLSQPQRQCNQAL